MAERALSITAVVIVTVLADFGYGTQVAYHKHWFGLGQTTDATAVHQQAPPPPETRHDPVCAPGLGSTDFSQHSDYDTEELKDMGVWGADQILGRIYIDGGP
jgi:hypothetical protein